MSHRPVLVVVGWLVAAVAAAVTGLAAVHVIGDGITGSADGVLSPQQVERRLASATAAPTPARTTAGPPAARPSVPARTVPARTAPARTAPAPTVRGGTGSPGAESARKTLSTPGGSVVAECRGREATLVTMSPAQGFGVKRADQGPGKHAEVTFEGPAGEIELRVQCVNGEPTAVRDDDD